MTFEGFHDLPGPPGPCQDRCFSIATPFANPPGPYSITVAITVNGPTMRSSRSSKKTDDCKWPKVFKLWTCNHQVRSTDSKIWDKLGVQSPGGVNGGQRGWVKGVPRFGSEITRSGQRGVVKGFHGLGVKSSSGVKRVGQSVPRFGSEITKWGQRGGVKGFQDLEVKSPGGVKGVGSKGSEIWAVKAPIGVKRLAQRIPKLGSKIIKWSQRAPRFGSAITRWCRRGSRG